MKVKRLESILENVEGFKNPKILLEQYETPASLGALILNEINLLNEITELSLADLGCGCGLFTIGCVVLNCKNVLSIEIEKEAFETCQRNLLEYGIDSEKVQLLQCCVLTLIEQEKYKNCVDVVIMNPPFGTKRNSGLDMKFLRIASFIAMKSIYSLHKTTTRNYVRATAQRCWNLKSTVIKTFRFPLIATFHCHKKEKVFIEVDLIRFDCSNKNENNIVKPFKEDSSFRFNS